MLLSIGTSKHNSPLRKKLNISTSHNRRSENESHEVFPTRQRNTPFMK